MGSREAAIAALTRLLLRAERVTSRCMAIHHITAIAGDPQRNLDFYAGTLGLRLVKLTVKIGRAHV